MKRIIAFVCVFLLLPCAALAAGGSNGLLYHVTGGNSEAWILGSIHIGSPDMYPFGQHILSALESADTLVFESDSDSDEAAELALSLMAADAPLRDRISGDAYALLEQVCEQTGYSLSYLSTLKTWGIVTLLSTQVNAVEMGMEDISAAASYGVETQIKQLAGNKPRLFLEDLREAMLVMDDFSPELQEYLLKDACQALLNPQTTDTALYPSWWRDGDAQAFANSFTLDTQDETAARLTEEYVDKMLTRRNQFMAKKIQSLLDDGQGRRYFITIGLMHLVLEDDSVLTLLASMDYQVDRLH